jgi:hypothetical protein
VEADVDGRYCGDKLDILVRMQDPFNYIAVRAVGCDDEGIYVVEDGVETLRLVTALGRGSHWRIEVAGSVIRYFVDDALRASATDDTFASGSVGIRMGSASGSLDAFEVRLGTP